MLTNRNECVQAQYATYMGLGGAMVWSIETDDFRGTCGGRPFSLIKTIVDAMNGPIVVPTTPAFVSTPSTAPTTIHTDSTTASHTTPASIPTVSTTPSASTTPNPICKYEGLCPNPADCGSFYECSKDQNGGWIMELNNCALGTVFNPAIQGCDWPYNVPGCENYPNKN